MSIPEMADVPDIHDHGSLEAWLADQTIQSAVVIAGRAALRVAPLARSRDMKQLTVLISAVFRANASARVAAKYPVRKESFGSGKRAAAASNADADAAAAAAAREAADSDTSPASRAAAAAANAARAADTALLPGYAQYGAVDAAAAAAEAAGHAYIAAYNTNIVTGVEHTIAAERATIIWAAVRADAATILDTSTGEFADMPLWLHSKPEWADVAWANLQTLLPTDEDWDVWIDWYEQRLRGGTRGEAHELAFANVPQKEWEKGPAAANAWIKARLPSPGNGKGQRLEAEIEGGGSLSSWLAEQNREAAVAIAGRTALRVLPLVVHALQGLPDPDLEHNVRQLASTVFRAGALARVAAKYPERAAPLQGPAAEASQVAGEAYRIAGHSAAAYGATNAAMASANSIFAVASSNAGVAAEATLNATVSVSGNKHVWDEIRADVLALKNMKTSAVADLPLWRRSKPQWANFAWAELQSLLPEGEHWDVWIEWYDERLRGGSRGEGYELIFASVPQEEWQNGPAAANAWISDRLRQLGAEYPASGVNIDDQNSLQLWLRRHSHKAAVAIAARNSLRVVPLTIRELQNRLDAGDTLDLGALVSSVFLPTAMAWVAAEYPRWAPQLGPGAERAAATARVHEPYMGPAGRATSEAGAVAAMAVSLWARAIIADANGDKAAAASFSNALASNIAANVATTAATFDYSSIWEEVRSDISTLEEIDQCASLASPLWRASAPEWAKTGWAQLQTALPKGEDWDVWVDWYEERLRGGSRAEQYELVFASVPLKVWGKGPAATNAWIRVHLPPVFEKGQDSLPPPLDNVPSVDTYAINVAGKIAVVPGPQNVPVFPFSMSEEDHRLWLSASRKLVHRLIDDIDAKKFGNFPVERYRDYLVRYESDLPPEPGIGNFVLADFEARSLRTLFAEEAQFLPATFSSRLKSFLESHFALRACYPTVARMYEAINTGRLQEPPPFHEFERFNKTVAEYQERFEPEVLQGLEQISRPEVLAPRETALPSTTTQFIVPPPDPLTEPDPVKERAFSMAGAANNIVAAARRGAEMGRTLDGWDKFLHTIHDAASVAIQWLHHFH